jgi:hypothetical protein
MGGENRPDSNPALRPMPSSDDTAAKTRDLAARRHAAQLALLQSGAEVRAGRAAACPLPPQQLAAIAGTEPFVVQALHGGLTAHVYRLRLAGRDWTLKRARDECLVRNVDGQTSFLNEIQRRRDFERLKRRPGGRRRFAAIVDTAFASLRHGILLSPWIEGGGVTQWNERRLEQLFAAILACAEEGLFEWDLCPGNILDDGRQVRLFDFGYMYRFDPLRHFNSAGNGRDYPVFHPVERFETRNHFAHLMRLQATQGAQAALAAYRLAKEIALEAYRRHRGVLARRGAQAAVLARLDGLTALWQQALRSDAAALYLVEGWRSHRLDLQDDLHGRTCTPATLERADWLLGALEHHHELLAAHSAFFGEDSGRSLAQRRAAVRAARAQARRWQVQPRAVPA